MDGDRHHTGGPRRPESEVPTKERYACKEQFQLSKYIPPARVRGAAERARW
jgi:hypothetical protein